MSKITYKSVKEIESDESPFVKGHAVIVNRSLKSLKLTLRSENDTWLWVEMKPSLTILNAIVSELGDLARIIGEEMSGENGTEE